MGVCESAQSKNKENKIVDSTLFRNDISLLQATSSLCKIQNNDKISSGFLIKLFKDKKDFFCLMTNEHVINKDMVKNQESFMLYFDNEKKRKKIKLDKNERYIRDFRDMNIDAIVIEILPEDDISSDFFLLPNVDYLDNKKKLINREIAVLQYSSGESCYSFGKIKSLKDNNEFTHLASTEKGSSGSPIFLKHSSKVIGINKTGSNTQNYGFFIGPIFNYFRQYSKNKKMNMHNIINNDKNINNGTNINIVKVGNNKNKNILKEEKRIELEDGGYYIGEITNDEIPNGKGKYFFNNGEIYEGSIKEDKFEGNGKYIYENGEYYIGEWKEDLRNGKGILYYKNGNIKYQGDFINDKYEGNGKYIWENGEYYIGEYKNGFNNGKGILYYKNGKIKYEGEFFNDKFEGNGKYIYDDEQYYIGHFKNGLKDGKGTLYYKNGNIEYDGDFKEGKYDGEGKYIYENGDYYIGQFKEGLCHGKGKEYDKNGNIINEGEWYNDHKI